MKKYVILAMGITLVILSTRFGWVIEGNEAIAATQQVKNGSDYVVGRSMQNLYQGLSLLLSWSGTILTVIGAWLFISQNKQTKPQNETEN